MNVAARLIFGLVLTAVSSRATPEFVGVLIAPGSERFALAEPNENRPARWVRLGQQIEGYTVAEYSPATEMLSLRGPSGTIQLSLRKDKVATLTATADEMLRIATQLVAGNEHWAEPIRFQGPHLFKGNWVVVAHHDGAGGAETRVVVFSAQGVMRDYLAPSPIAP